MNADTISVYDNLIENNDSQQLLTPNESTVKLKQNEVIPLTEFFGMNKIHYYVLWYMVYETCYYWICYY